MKLLIICVYIYIYVMKACDLQTYSRKHLTLLECSHSMQAAGNDQFTMRVGVLPEPIFINLSAYTKSCWSIQIIKLIRCYKIVI